MGLHSRTRPLDSLPATGSSLLLRRRQSLVIACDGHRCLSGVHHHLKWRGARALRYGQAEGLHRRGMGALAPARLFATHARLYINEAQACDWGNFNNATFAIGYFFDLLEATTAAPESRERHRVDAFKNASRSHRLVPRGEG